MLLARSSSRCWRATIGSFCSGLRNGSMPRRLARCEDQPGRRAMKSISTRAPLASPVTPMQVRAGRLLGGKYEA